ncbi:MAG: gamma-glutamylcyclotransferase family protein [Syntrophobacteraceae bacterium]|jgi:gamma-glutamylcyclotransferase (GGCT)/AIG2-like uncharacterized protein YtfP
MKSELRVFVYGTLKRGFSNHRQYCTGVLRICPARLRGKLFKLTAEIPVMTVADENILVHGTESIVADIEAQERFESLLKSKGVAGTARSGGPEWGKIQGELHIFDDPQTRLPLLDSLEEFRPGWASPYIRVLVYITLPGDSQTSAWTYIAGFDTASLEEYAGERWEEPGNRI